MIDLRNTYVVIRTQEEYENILKIAGKQGFHWYEKEDARPFVFTFSFPYILHFRSDYIIGVIRKDLKLNFIDYKCYEASELIKGKAELIKGKELTAREFIEEFYKISVNCKCQQCKKCKLGKDNTKCKRSLCISSNWKNNVDELIEIISDMIIEEKEIKRIENFIQNSHKTLDKDIINALEIIIKRLKEK